MDIEKAKEGKRLLNQLDAAERLPDKISKLYRQATTTRGTKQKVAAIEELANLAHSITDDLIRHIKKDIDDL